MSYTFVGDAYDRTTPIEMTQVNPEPALPAKPTIDEVQVLDIEDLSHISLHQVKCFLIARVHCFEQVAPLIWSCTKLTLINCRRYEDLSHFSSTVGSFINGFPLIQYQTFFASVCF